MKASYSATDARSNFYELLKLTSQGLLKPEITHREFGQVVMMSKDEYESWMETLDIMSNPEEYKALQASLKETEFIPFEDLVKDMDLDEG